MIELAASAFLASGAVFSALGVLGLFRMPDVFTRIHAAAKVITLGSLLSLLGVSLSSGGSVAIRAISILVFLFLTTPVATHAVARAAHRRGEDMAPGTIVDELARDEPQRR